MPFVKRDSAGRIIAAGNTPSPDRNEEVVVESPDLQLFIASLGGENNPLESSDLKMIRTIEDVIDLLISKNLICITDLPIAVQSKLMERRSLRHTLNALNLIGEDDQGII